MGAKKVPCSDGDHFLIDIEDVAIEYKATRLETTISGLSAFGGMVKIDPKTLQKAAVATQKMNEFLKALVAGYNSCAISKKQYQKGMEKLYPSLVQDSLALEKFRQQLVEDRKVDEKRFTVILNRYEKTLKEFADLSGKGIDYDRIEAIVEGQSDRIIDSVESGVDNILARLDQLDRQMAARPLPKPEEVKSKIMEKIIAMSETAESEYNKGYVLLQRYRFHEALPHLEKAITLLKLPEFSIALGRAYEGLLEFDKAMEVYKKGQKFTKEQQDAQGEALVISSRFFNIILKAKHTGKWNSEEFIDLLTYWEKINRKELTRLISFVADEGDAQMVMSFFLSIMFTNSMTRSNRTIYWKDAYERFIEKGDNLEALQVLSISTGLMKPAQVIDYLKVKLKENEEEYGKNHPRVALCAIMLANMYCIYKEMGKSDITSYDLKSALNHARLALAIDEEVYGPEHRNLALDLFTIGYASGYMGEYDDGIRHLKKSLKITEIEFGPTTDSYIITLYHIAILLKLKGDFDGALEYLEELLMKLKSFSPDYKLIPQITKEINEIHQLSNCLNR
jgi:tetratricopeptide (TPR) repeat protein